jgi:hypothetical protein
MRAKVMGFLEPLIVRFKSPTLEVDVGCGCGRNS